MQLEKSIFISYRRTNFYIARSIHQYLERHGFDMFLDIENMNGGAFEQILLNQIAGRAHFVVVLTPSAVERCVSPRDWVRKEIEYAMDLKRNIIPLMFEGFDFAKAKPYLTGKLEFLSQYNAVHVPDDFFNEAMERLRTRFLNVPLELVLHPIPLTDTTAIEEKLKNEKTLDSFDPDLVKAEHHYERAVEYDDDPTQAVEELTKAIDLNPAFWQAYYMRGRHHIYLRQSKNALADLEQGIKLAPSHISSLFRAAIFRVKGDFNSALHEANEAVSNNPNDYLAYYERGKAHFRLREVSDSIEDYTQVIQLNPLFGPAFTNRGNNYKYLGQFEQAIENYNQALSLYPNSPVVLNNRGEANFMTGNYLAALVDFRKANEVRPAFNITLAGLAVTYHALERTNEAIRIWRNLIGQDRRYKEIEWVKFEIEWIGSDGLLNEAKRLIELIPNTNDPYVE